MTDKIVILVACGSRREARRIAKSLVSRRLAACAQELGGSIHSTYRWKGKTESAKEFLLLIKTSQRRLKALRAEVERLHSYDVPEFIALPIASGSPAYLRWLDDCLRPSRAGSR